MALKGPLSSGRRMGAGGVSTAAVARRDRRPVRATVRRHRASFPLFFSFQTLARESVARDRLAWRVRALFFSSRSLFSSTFSILFGVFPLPLCVVTPPPKPSRAPCQRPATAIPMAEILSKTIFKRKKRDHTNTGRARRRQARPGAFGVGGGHVAKKTQEVRRITTFFFFFFSFCIHLRSQGRADLHGTPPRSLACVSTPQPLVGSTTRAPPIPKDGACRRRACGRGNRSPVGRGKAIRG